MRRRPSTAVPRDVHTEWWWPPSPTVFRTTQAGFADFEHIVLPEIDPGPRTSIAMVHEFKLSGGDEGLFGLESGDRGPEPGMARYAVFSIVNAIAAEGGSAIAAEGGSAIAAEGGSAIAAEGGSAGPGAGGRRAWTCRIAYPWQEGRSYAMRLWSEAPGWWSATVADLATGEVFVIGRIRVPDDWRQLAGWSVMSTRYPEAAVGRCDDLPECRVAYREPTANESRVHPVRHENHLGPGTCESSRAADVRGGVRHEIGGPP